MQRPVRGILSAVENLQNRITELFLATLVALHITPVSERQFQKTVASPACELVLIEVFELFLLVPLLSSVLNCFHHKSLLHRPSVVRRIVVKKEKVISCQ